MSEKKSKKILAIDTTSAYQSIAIWNGKEISSYVYSLLKSSHTETLLPTIDYLLELSGINGKDFDVIASVTGPGSFTGIRIGMSTAAGLAEAWQAETTGCNSLFLHCLQPNCSDGYICPVLDAKRGALYTALFKKQSNTFQQILPYSEVSIENFLDFIKGIDKVNFIGSGIQYIMPLLKKMKQQNFDIVNGPLFPMAYLLAYVLGENKLEVYEEIYNFKAFYIRPPDAKPPKKIL